MSTNYSVGEPNTFGPGTVLISDGLLSVSSWQIPETNDLKKIQERLSVVEERLLIIYPDKEMHEKYPALKEAYEAYKVIEKLVK